MEGENYIMSKTILEIATYDIITVTVGYIVILYIHFVVYISSVRRVTYLQYKWRYKRMFIDWAIILSLYVAIIIDILKTYNIINLN